MPPSCGQTVLCTRLLNASIDPAILIPPSVTKTNRRQRESQPVLERLPDLGYSVTVAWQLVPYRGDPCLNHGGRRIGPAII